MHRAEPGRWSRTLRGVERLLLIAGVGLFVFLLYDLGTRAVLTNLSVVGWGLVPIVLQEILAFLANTLGWRLAFPPHRYHVAFRTLLAARIAGDAVNYLTPTATVGGEFVRARLLRGRVPTAPVVASLVLARLTQAVGLLVFVAVGLATVVDPRLLPPGLQSGLLIGLGCLAGLLVLVTLAQRRGMFGLVLDLMEMRFHGARSSSLGRALLRFDEEIARSHRHGRIRLLLSTASFGLGFACGAVESYLALWFIGVPVTAQRALTVEVLSVVFNNLLFFVPLRAGVQEAGKVLIFTLLGLDPAKGLAVGVLYRIRELAWALAGLVIFYFQRRGLVPAAGDPNVSGEGDLRKATNERRVL